jgi:enoyl-CoA hydratase/carnithine racemase
MGTTLKEGAMETLLLETKGPVVWVWLNQARRLNAINQTTLTELRETFETLDRDRTTRVIVLAGRGPVFSAGFDVSWMAQQDAEAVAGELADVEAVYDTIEACRKPVIAAIQGPAMGGGLLLALVADFCLASEEATFAAPEVKIGIFPNLSLIPRLERVVGVGAAKRMVLTGDPVSAAEASGIGLVEQVLSPEALHAEAQSLAEQLAGLPAYAVQVAKGAFAAARGSNFVSWERSKFVDCWARPERKTAMQAFLQLRTDKLP